ncbi:hypothetical protein HXX01_01575 [Candidatus Nomurabacteria bacterium]|nr:hypothetical protein [Candidatus Nomurabacteria bacterium]
MDKIKSKMHRGNKHFVWGLSFVVFGIIASVVWGLTYAEDVVPVTTPTVPLPVVNLVGNVSGNSVVLTWTNTSTNQDKYNISRRMNGGALIGLAMVPGPDPASYTDTTVTAGNTYDYQVEACLSGTGCSYMTQVTGIIIPTTGDSGGSGGGTTNPPQAPSAPSNLRINTSITIPQNSNMIPLTWMNNSTVQSGFSIERKLSSGSAWTTIPQALSGTASSYTDYSAPLYNSYDYRIQACLPGSGCSPYTLLEGVYIPINGTTNNTTCTGLNLILTGNKTTYNIGDTVSYSWSCLPAGTTGNVSMWLQKPNESTPVAWGSGSGSSSAVIGFGTSNLVPGQYTLKACLGSTCTTIMSTQTFTITSTTTTTTNPAAPTNLTATADGGTVTLNWTDNSNNEAGFKIYRGPNWTDIGNVGPNVTTFVDSNRPVGTYTYHLNAFNSSYLYSPITNDVTVTVTTTTTNTTTAPPSPSSFRISTTILANAISLLWNNNSSIQDAIKIQKKLSSAISWVDLPSISGLISFYTDSAVTVGTSYDYRIQSCILGLCSPYISLEKIYPATTSSGAGAGAGAGGGSTCTGLNLVLNDGKTIYKVGDMVNYTWTCVPAGSTGTVSMWLNKPDGTMVNYNTGTGSNTQTMGFSTSNLVPGQYVLKACLGTNCTTAGTTITTQMFNVVSATANTTDNAKPTAPTNLTATVSGSNVTLNWVDNSSNEAGFKIYRGPVWTDIGNVGPNVTTFIDAKRPVGIYTYHLNAFNSSYLYSPITNDVTATVSSTTTTVPVTPVTPITTPAIIPDTTLKTAIPPTTVNTTVAKTSIETSSTNTGTGLTTKLATTAVTEIKESAPAPVETPKEIINNVTDALNILFKTNETATGGATAGTNGTATTQTTNNGDVKAPQPAPTPAQIAEEVKAKEEIVKLVYQDTNKDGISDYDSKYVYNMDPVKASPVSTYEGKSINAGEKILLGFDPSKKELEKVVAEEPTAETKPEIVVSSYRVSGVSFVDTAPVKETTVNKEIAPVKETTPTKETIPTKEVKPDKAIAFKGVALPNSFITIYIYSTPIMVTVKTDKNGEWNYTLDKELENGKHTVYTATVNNTGNIVAKSTPFTFVKTAEAVTLQDVIPVRGVEAATVVEKPGFLQTKNIFFVMIGALMMIGITLILIGLFSKKSTQ